MILPKRHQCTLQCDSYYTGETKYSNLTIRVCNGLRFYTPLFVHMEIGFCGHPCRGVSLHKCCRCRWHEKQMCIICKEREKYQPTPELLKYVRSQTREVLF